MENLKPTMISQENIADVKDEIELGGSGCFRKFVIIFIGIGPNDFSY